ncbi:hypothetical protein PoB_001303400 [Plakobranchus ocellatus]|uniref:Uncharacterized protein n=1 Tax=Plakobranchus ocellatus TaxID=259542 RepID=A0AAV3YXS6_9GAST|nr:hypothetical protein PoB_001303400 [Plakobranchus ocellatus]
MEFRGVVAHLVGQSATKSEIRGRIPVRAKSVFLILVCVHTALNGYLGLLRPGESKGGEETNGKLPHKCRMPRTIRTLLLVPRCLE